MMIFKVIGATVGVLIALALIFGIASLALWWLVPVAFPAAAGYTWIQALALTGIVAIIGLPFMSK